LSSNNLLDQKGVEADWLLDIHAGYYGPINLQPCYSYVLGLCVLKRGLIALGGQVAMRAWGFQPKPSPLLADAELDKAML
jgi:hypothetical protein